MDAQDIIIRPIITEKSMNGAAMKKYTFEVAKNAEKIQIKKAVEELFGVKMTPKWGQKGVKMTPKSS